MTHTQALTSNHSRPRAKSERIPRPPNAFMLFRSDLLARGVIPFDIECRQQKLSRVAGQCWNLLPKEEKEVWQDKAKQALAEHLMRYPGYKYAPAPRGSRRPKSLGNSCVIAETADSEDRIRKIREDYVHILGPPASPAKRSSRKRQERAYSTETELPLSSISEVSSTFSPPWSHLAGHEDNKEAMLSPLTPLSPQCLLPQITLTPLQTISIGFPTMEIVSSSKRAKFSLMDLLNPVPESRPITPLPSSNSEPDNLPANTYLPTLDESFHTFLPMENCCYDDYETIDCSSSASASSDILRAISLPLLTLEDYSPESPLRDLCELDLSEFDTEWNGF